MLVLALLLSILLWVLATLNQNYEMQLEYKIAIDNVPKELFLTQQNSHILSVKARGPGVDLIVESIRARRDTLFLPYRDAMREDSNVPIDVFVTEVQNNFQENTMEILGIKPDFLELGFEEKIFKKVPLRLNTSFNLRRGYQLENKPLPDPDYVTIYGPPERIKEIPYWQTMSTSTEKISEPGVIEVPVDTQKGLVISPPKVKVALNPRLYTEQTFPLYVEVVNEPPATHVRLSSDTIYVTCLLPLDEYEIITDMNFRKKIILDFSTLDPNFPHVIPKLNLSGSVIEVYRKPFVLSYVIVSEL